MKYFAHGVKEKYVKLNVYNGLPIPYGHGDASSTTRFKVKHGIFGDNTDLSFNKIHCSCVRCNIVKNKHVNMLTFIYLAPL